MNKTMTSFPQESWVTWNAFDYFPVFPKTSKNIFFLWDVNISLVRTNTFCCALVLGSEIVGLPHVSVVCCSNLIIIM